MHDKLVNEPSLQNKEEFMVPMATLAYYYFIEGQINNLFLLLNQTNNLEL